MTTQFPAIIIGGVPNRGKSVVSAILKSFLISRQIPHYLYRASPDGEGIWYNEMEDRVAAKVLRNKAEWTSYFEESVEHILTHRPLPFLVDVGGEPTPYQQSLFRLATHAILLGANEEEFNKWREIMERQGVEVVAEILSQEQGSDEVLAEDKPLRIRLARLIRGCAIESDTSFAWQALFKKVEETLGMKDEEVWAFHQQQIDTQKVPFHADQWRKKDAPSRVGKLWTYTDLQPLRNAIAEDATIALYEARPIWVASALAIHLSNSLQCFDARMGWVDLPTLTDTSDEEQSPWRVDIRETDKMYALDFWLKFPHLSYHREIKGILPNVPPDKPLVLGGKFPIWIFAALSRYYAQRGHHVGIAIPPQKCALLLNGPNADTTISWQAPVQKEAASEDKGCARSQKTATV